MSHREWKHTFAFDKHFDSSFEYGETSNQHAFNAHKYSLDLNRYDHSEFLDSEESRKCKACKNILQRYAVCCGIAEPRISYAAFYGDCLHEIVPVTMGMRLTLSYQLIRCSDNGSTLPTYDSHIKKEDDFHMISIPKMIYDPELSELTRLIATQPHEVDVKTFTEKLSAATLKYLVLASDKYGSSLDLLKVDVFKHLTHMKPPNPSTFSPPQ